MISREFQARLSARAATGGIDIHPSIRSHLEELFRLLTHWNRTINLTSLPLDPPTDAAIDRLLIEPLAAADHISETPEKWLDLGSGGGSPAVPIKLVHPEIPLTLVEARTRRAAFLREVVRTLQLADTTVSEARFEELAVDTGYVGQADLMTVRAVRADEQFFAVLRALAKPGGQLLMFRSDADPDLASTGFRITASISLANNPRSRLVSLEPI